MAQWLERGALQWLQRLPAMRVQSPLDAVLQKNVMSTLSMLGHRCFDDVSMGKAFHLHVFCVTQSKMTEMSVCTPNL